MAANLSLSRAPADSAAASIRLVDVCGVVLSGLCAVHCAVTPVLVSVLPAVAGEGTETQLRRVLILLGLIGVGLGTALHRDRRGLVPLAGGLMLTALLEVGAVVPAFEVFVALGISALLISAHALNTRACNKHCHSCAPARFWTAQVDAIGASKLGPGLLAFAAAILVHATVLAVALRVEASPASSPSMLPQGARTVEIEVQGEQPAVEALSAPQLAATSEVSRSEVIPPPKPARSPSPSKPVASASAGPVVFDDALSAPPRSALPVAFEHAAVPARAGGRAGGAGRAGSSAAVAAVGAAGSATGAGSSSSSSSSSGAQLTRRPAQPAGLEARIEAHYPAQARLQQLGGVGRARVLVSAEGVVTRAEAASEAPASSGFAEACARALSGSRGWGEPLDASGRPTNTWIHFSCEFSIRH